MFKDEVSDFNAYMQSAGNVNPHSRTNYLSWLRFLSQSHEIGGNLDIDQVERIIESERAMLGTRDRYNSTKDLTNFRSALKTYLAFLASGYTKRRAEEEAEAVETVVRANNITATERQQLIAARVGQGLFRQRLVDMWHGCAVSHCTAIGILVVSHIKPWRVADNNERLDVYNGLLFLPNIDKLFDKGYITFKDSGAIKISSFIEPTQYPVLGISSETRLVNLDTRHLPYMEYHRQNCFIGV